MVDSDLQPPNQILIDFLTDLPSTIKGDIIGMVAVYSELSGLTMEHLKVGAKVTQQMIVDHLNVDGLTAFGRVVITVAMLDYILQTRVSRAPMNEAFLKELESRRPEIASLGLVARRQQAEMDDDLSFEKWNALRRGALSFAALQRFEDKVLR